MSRSFKFNNPEGVYFVSFAVVEWINIFINDDYKKIILESLKFCQKEKGMEIFAWCIMPSHIHLIFRSIKEEKPEQLLGDFKRFTSKAMVKAIQNNSNECRKDWLLQKFEIYASKSSNVTQYQFWRHDNKPVELWSNKFIDQKLDYLHNNPVVDGLASKPEDYKYSSAADYCGMKGLLDDILVIY